MSVSALVPVHNGAEFLTETLESIYAQTMPPEEVIVVDDGSTDATPLILSRFEGRTGFRWFRQPQSGEASARNACVEHARGEYVAFLDHDDLWRPSKLERQLAAFDPSWSMSFTAVEHWWTATSTSEIRQEQNWDPDPKAVVSRLGRACVIETCSAVLVRTNVLRAMGPFEDLSPYGTDWLMWLRIAAAGNRIGYLRDPLTVYRWHGRNLSTDPGGTHFKVGCEVFDRFGDRRLRAWWRLLAASYAHEHQDSRRARRRILEAARIRPWSLRPGWLRLLF